MATEKHDVTNEFSGLAEVKPEGQQFCLRVPMDCRQLYSSQLWSGYSTRFLSRLLRKCSLFIDVGAGYGFYSLLAGTESPGLEIMALEPDPGKVEVLRKNLQAARLRARVDLAAASDRTHSELTQANAAVDDGRPCSNPITPSTASGPARLVRLDDLLKDRESCRAVVRVNAAGQELAVLRGMREVLRRFPQISMVIEFNPSLILAEGSTPGHLIAELESAGFSAFLLDDRRSLPIRFKANCDWHSCVGASGQATVYCVKSEAALSVCFFSHSSYLAGAERSLVQLVAELVADHGAVCTVVAPGEGPIWGELDKAGAGRLQANYGWWAAIPPTQPASNALTLLEPQVESLVKQTLPLLGELDPDFLWTQTLAIPWGAVSASLLGKPHIWSVCEYGERGYGLKFFAPFPRVIGDILESSALVYTAIDDIRKTLFSAASAEQCRVLYRNIQVPPSPAKAVSTGLFKCPGAVRLGMFATLSESKGQEQAIRAVAKLISAGEQVELVLAGYCDTQFKTRVEQLIKELAVEQYVRLVGFLPDPFPAMQECDLVLVCTWCEAFGRTTVEAMLAGKTVVYAASGGALEYMVDGVTGLAYRPGDVEDLLGKIRRLAHDPEQRKRLGAAAQAHARQRFSPENYGGEVFRRLLELRLHRVGPARMPSIMRPLVRESILSMASHQPEVQVAPKVARKKTGVDRSSQELRESEAETERLRQELARLHKQLKLPLAVRDFLVKQRRSVQKRAAEARNLLFRIGLALGCNRHFRDLQAQRELILSSRIFDDAWYRQHYAELLVSQKCDPVLHYLRVGAEAGCNPNSLFDTLWYLDQIPEAVRAGINPLVHYLSIGWQKGFDPSPSFSPGAYLEANPDVAAAGLEPLAHYLWTGIKEGRPLEPGIATEFNREPDVDPNWPVPDVRLIAFYLPQFHCIPENDAWWGKGFTEWTNVKAARPQLAGHYQPHVPHPSVGYYDLTDETVLERQAAMARQFGIHGFCYHHYWFAGKRLLEMPVERMLRTGKPDFPFCLCWANENWTRRWDGAEQEVLIAQKHSPEDDERFIRDLLRAFRDRRYIRIDGRPLLVVYRPSLLPEPKATFARWRQVCRSEGVELFLVGAQSFDFKDPRPHGLDAAVEFPPHNTGVPALSHDEYETTPEFEGLLFDYHQMHLNMRSCRTGDYHLIRCLSPSWDNTARRRRHANIFLNSSPTNYFVWLRHLVRQTRARCKSDERVIFINAWNEWAEGCHLEPDQRYGFAWLNATRRALLSGLRVPEPGPAPARKDLPVEQDRSLAPFAAERADIAH